MSMTSEQQPKAARTPVDRPFPWRCSNPKCLQKAVFPAKTDFTAQVAHDGRSYEIAVPDLDIPTCQACGEKFFSAGVDDRIFQALRLHLRLLTPSQSL